MSIEFIGFSATQEVSETVLPQGSVVNKSFLGAVARAHEYAGFDRVLVAHSSASVDGFQVASYIASQTQKLGILLAHRPGFVSPTLAARQFASLDQFSGGRLAVHYISGGSDDEQKRDGDWLDHDQRYARTDEYLDVLRKVWTADKPFDHQGAHYRFQNAFSDVKPVQSLNGRPHVPVYFGGASEAAIPVAGKHADVYALWGESLDQARELTTRVRAEAAKHGRQVRFSVSFRPILAETEDKAWARAESILAETKRLRVVQGFGVGGPQQSEGAKRLLAAADKGPRVDKRLWTAVAQAIGGRSNSTALVGTPEQVADALLDYYDLGVTTFLIRGFDPLEDATDYGRALIPRTRELVAQRIASQRKAA